ncbi:uncharacterized protein LDX57_009284 [Aspergillus melleus]|uniref:uncharacterized protein n=1 Tax=Aspergillus melleus TaxID=138277 RepID=UPI001E8E51B0|nr:uncharacterized protein LDX57_009284 [Aspergillus melleus]KAH8431627.1 hypothetical protein LDX57_009284 [Aspergillus melleus]
MGMNNADLSQQAQNLMAKLAEVKKQQPATKDQPLDLTERKPGNAPVADEPVANSPIKEEMSRSPSPSRRRQYSRSSSYTRRPRLHRHYVFTSSERSHSRRRSRS